MRARRRQLARLERLAGPVIEHLSVAGARREREIATRIYSDALIHAASFSLIVLFGDPQINEPLSSAWERCCNSNSPELYHPRWKKNVLITFDDPFDLQIGHFSAQLFREIVMPHLPSADEKEKFAPIFANAPLWLVWFTFADGTMEELGLPPRDLSEIRRFRRPRECFLNWPALPPGKFENIPWSDSELAERHRISQKADEIWKLLEDDISLGPRCGPLEFKYRFPKKFVK